jgi:hypothetical protein
MPPSHSDRPRVDVVIPAAEPGGDLLRDVQSALNIEILDGPGPSGPAAARTWA